MSSPILFRIMQSTSSFLDPRKEFELTTQPFQVRLDPLTGRSGHFSHFGAIKPQPLDMGSYERPEVKGFCPFCPDKRARYTPRFTQEIVPEGQMARGEALLVPNLYPYDVYSAVVIMTEGHVVPLDRFTESNLSDALALGVHFLKAVRAAQPALPFHIMTWNYMPPSGGGLVHPHQQYFATPQPGNQYLNELGASEDFFKGHGVSFWSELIAEEQGRDERYIGKVGTSHWLSSFVSLGVLGDVVAILPERFCIDDITDADIADVTSGLLKLFRYFHESGIHSFNAAWFVGPGSQTCFPIHLRIIPRTFLNMRDYAPDVNFFQALLVEPVSVVLPEDLCAQIKPFFV
jgi:UDPglucose--hexose-1-phosphate uridylyltransferase